MKHRNFKGAHHSKSRVTPSPSTLINLLTEQVYTERASFEAMGLDPIQTCQQWGLEGAFHGTRFSEGHVQTQPTASYSAWCGHCTLKGKMRTGIGGQLQL